MGREKASEKKHASQVKKKNINNKVVKNIYKEESIKKKKNVNKKDCD